MSETHDTDGTEDPHYEVVIRGGEMSKDHANLMRERLLNDGFRDDAVSVREVANDVK
jgi:hypothetical protein